MSTLKGQIKHYWRLFPKGEFLLEFTSIFLPFAVILFSYLSHQIDPWPKIADLSEVSFISTILSLLALVRSKGILRASRKVASITFIAIAFICLMGSLITSVLIMGKIVDYHLMHNGDALSETVHRWQLIMLSLSVFNYWLLGGVGAAIEKHYNLTRAK